MKLGRIDVEPVIDGRILGPLPASGPFPPTDSVLWTDQGGMLHDGGVVESTLGGFLVRSGDRLVLVDAGAGPALADRSAQLSIEQGRLRASLHEMAVRPDDITDVVLTHLHFDHIGWVSVDGVPVFPNATVRCAAADLEYFLAGPDEERHVIDLYGTVSSRERLEPVLERIETWDGDGPLGPGIDVRLAAGHTPGSSVVVLSDGNARALLLGDIVHCPLELMVDDFDLLVDHDPALAADVRIAYARELEGTDVLAAAAHFPGLRFGRLLPGEVDRRWTFA